MSTFARHCRRIERVLLRLICGSDIPLATDRDDLDVALWYEAEPQSLLTDRGYPALPPLKECL